MRGTEFRKIVPAAASRYKRMTHVLRFGRERHGRGGDEGKDVIRENWKSSELSEKTSVTEFQTEIQTTPFATQRWPGWDGCERAEAL